MKTHTDWRALLLGVNWFGVVVAILMLVLAISGAAWWNINVGGQAIAFSTSPFNVEISAFGASMMIPLITFFCIGARIAVSIAAIFLLVGSLFSARWWSKKFVSFGALKMLWMVIGIIVMGVIMGAVSSMLASQMAAGAAGAQMQMNMPTLSGTGNITIQMGGQATLSAPVTMALTGAFFTAIVAGALGIVTRIYHRRLTKGLAPKAKVAPKVEVKEGFVSTQPALGDLKSAEKSFEAKSYDESVKNADKAIETALNGWLEQSGLGELKGKDYPAAIKGLKGLKYKVPCEKEIQNVRGLRNKVKLRYSPKKGEAEKAVKTAEKFIREVQKIKIRKKAA